MGFLNKNRLIPEEVLGNLPQQETVDERKKQRRELSNLLDNLPGFNLPEYLGLVFKLTSYRWNIHLYTDFGINSDLHNKLAQRGIVDFKEVPTKRQPACLLGKDLRGIPEIPGIGIQFDKEINRHSVNRETPGGYVTTTEIEMDSIYAKLVAPRMGIILNGARAFNRIEVTSLEVFDDALEEALGFPYRHFTHKIQRHLYPNQPRSGNEVNWGGHTF